MAAIGHISPFNYNPVSGTPTPWCHHEAGYFALLAVFDADFAAVFREVRLAGLAVDLAAGFPVGFWECAGRPAEPVADPLAAEMAFVTSADIVRKPRESAPASSKPAAKVSVPSTPDKVRSDREAAKPRSTPRLSRAFVSAARHVLKCSCTSGAKSRAAAS